jgi:hypothetical protein
MYCLACTEMFAILVLAMRFSSLSSSFSPESLLSVSMSCCRRVMDWGLVFLCSLRPISGKLSDSKVASPLRFNFITETKPVHYALLIS